MKMTDKSKSRRLPAEWEHQSCVMFTFPHKETDWADNLEAALSCFVACVAAVARFQNVLLVTPDPALTQEQLVHIPSEKLTIVECASNDTWARDHGPITVLEGEKPLLLDFVFNGWGLKFAADKDNLINKSLFKKGVWPNTDLLDGGLVLEGGAIETDGAGTLMTTSACLLSPNRNPHLSKSEIENTLSDQLGVDRFLWLDNGYLAGDDTDSHIDTLARFCAVDTIVYMQCKDTEDEHYTALKAMEEELAKFRTRKAEPYKLIPLPWPTACYAQDGHRLPATYANFLIINDAVLVPVYGVPEDDLAINTLAACFPNREVVAIHCRPLIEQHGSLHCISMQLYS